MWCDQFASWLVVGAFENHASITYRSCTRHKSAAYASLTQRKYEGKGALQITAQAVLREHIEPA
jgi:hypothetical protein